MLAKLDTLFIIVTVLLATNSLAPCSADDPRIWRIKRSPFNAAFIAKIKEATGFSEDAVSVPEAERSRVEVLPDPRRFSEMLGEQLESLPSSRRSARSPFNDEMIRTFQENMDHFKGSISSNPIQSRNSDSVHTIQTGADVYIRKIQEAYPSSVQSQRQTITRRRNRPITYTEVLEKDVEDRKQVNSEALSEQSDSSRGAQPTNYRRVYNQSSSDQNSQQSQSQIISEQYYEAGTQSYENTKLQAEQVSSSQKQNSEDNENLKSGVGEHMQRKIQLAQDIGSGILQGIMIIPEKISDIASKHPNQEAQASDSEEPDIIYEEYYTEIIDVDDPSEPVAKPSRSSSAGARRSYARRTSAGNTRDSAAENSKRTFADGSSQADFNLRTRLTATRSSARRLSNAGHTRDSQAADNSYRTVEDGSSQPDSKIRRRLTETRSSARRSSSARGTGDSQAADNSYRTFEDASSQPDSKIRRRLTETRSSARRSSNARGTGDSQAADNSYRTVEDGSSQDSKLHPTITPPGDGDETQWMTTTVSTRKSESQ